MFHLQLCSNRPRTPARIAAVVPGTARYLTMQCSLTTICPSVLQTAWIVIIIIAFSENFFYMLSLLNTTAFMNNIQLRIQETE